MFNITQVNNKINITSEGIDFRITGSLVSGTSLVVANIEAIGYDWDVSYSGTMVNVKLISLGGNLFLRNGDFDCPVTTDEVARQSQPFESGTTVASWVGADGWGWIGAVVANGKYIYYTVVKDDDSTLRVYEYNSTNNITNYIEVVSGISIYEIRDTMALIEKRKVLVAAVGTGTKNVYIVDFEANTSSLSTAMTTQIDVLRTHIMDDGHIWGYALGKTTTGYQVKYKDFTDDTSWISVTIAIAYNTHPTEAVFVGKDYLVWFADKKIDASTASVIPIVFDCSNHTLYEGSSVSHSTDDGVSLCAIITIGCAWKSIGPRAYCTAVAWGVNIYYKEQVCVEYNPYIDFTSIVYEHKWHALGEEGTGIPLVQLLSSNNYAYIINFYDGVLTGLGG